MKTQPSHYSRIAVSTLTLALSFFGNPAASLPQDIAGGASVVLASADVEAKLGKGIFTTRTRAHTTKNLEKKTVARSAHTAQTQKQTSTSGGKQETAKQTTSSGGKQETTRRTTSSGKQQIARRTTSRLVAVSPTEIATMEKRNFVRSRSLGVMRITQGTNL